MNTEQFIPLPKWNSTQKDRRAGFEFEISGIEIDECLETVQELFGGEVKQQNSVQGIVESEKLGEFKVELDSRLVKHFAALMDADTSDHQPHTDINMIRKTFSRWIGDRTAEVVPIEISTSPLDFRLLSELENLKEKLRKRKAKGTHAAFYKAFGMHINIEIPSEDVQTISRILKAFIVLHPWLQAKLEVDLSRRALSFIQSYSNEYLFMVLDKNYKPDMDKFIDDYIYYNPNRNMALDMLPIFTLLKPDCMEQLQGSDKELTQPRPAFHYRLPNCNVDDENWTIKKEWNSWVIIEQLACNEEKLDYLSREYLKFMEKPLTIFDDEWVKFTERVMTDA